MSGGGGRSPLTLTTSSLEALFRPRRVAVVGASETPGSGMFALRNLMDSPRLEGIFPVNPRRSEVFGLRSYPSLRDLKGEVETVIVAVPRRFVLEVLRDAADAGLRAAVIFASGFAEYGQDGGELQAAIAELCRETGLRVCGPNCMGIANLHDATALYKAPVPKTFRPGPVAVVAQSGSMSINLAANERGLGVSHVISTGNEADLETADYMQWLVDDPHTKVIAVYLEGIKSPSKFVAAAHAAFEAKKPVLVLKIGRTQVGQRAARTHTGSMAGSDAVHDAVFDALGVIRVRDLDEMLETALLLTSVPRLPSGDRVALVTNSGGEVGLLADLAAEIGLRAPPDFAPATRERLAAELSEFGTPDLIANPLDTTGGAHDAAARCVRVVAQDPGFDVVAVSQSIVRGDPTPANIARSIRDVASSCDKPVVAFTPIVGPVEEAVGEPLRSAGVPLLMGTWQGLTAIRNMTWYATRRPRTLTLPHPSAPTPGRMLSERESKLLLAEYGVPVTREALARTADQAVEIAASLGYPVVLKVEAPGLLHKSDQDAVRLNVRDEAAVREVFAKLSAAHAADLSGVLVSEMVLGGVPVLVGVQRDAQFGPVLVFSGLGGVLTELFQDVSMHLPPVDHAEALAMIDETRGARLLRGFRGAPALDVDAVADVLVRVGRLADEMRDTLLELDINPLIVRPQGAVAVDALIALGERPT